MTFRPKLLDTLKTYDRHQLSRDIMAGLIVGIVALPLAIAFAIASGVSPEKGLYTAVIAGFIISALGGSRVQIGGPTGAFIVIVYGIVQQYDVSGLIIATFMAGVMLVLMGVARLGTIIQFIPYPLIAGFTSGIALIIFSSQIKDFFGLDTGNLPADFIGKWQVYFTHLAQINWYAVAIAAGTVLITLYWTKLNRWIPGSLMSIIVATAAVTWLGLPVETIGGRFGDLPSSLPAPSIPDISFDTIRELIQPAFTIALLGGIESLLSAVVADGMTGGNHRSNTELVAQGAANICSSLFGGIPATGAIARTATNVKNGGRTPVAGMVHAVVLFLILLFAGKWAALIPLASLAGILVVVAYHMSEWKTFVSLLRGPRSDMMVLLTTFLLTVLVDLTVAIEIGMLLAILLFMRSVIQVSGARPFTKPASEDNDITAMPEGVNVFEITGPLFFGAAHKFKRTLQIIDKLPPVLIIRMSQVPIIDASGIRALQEIHKETRQKGTRIILSEVYSEQVKKELQDARLLFAIGKANVTDSFEKALERGRILAQEHAVKQ
ncbi:MAG TPA: sulfate permease [Chitinophagaceae bacterium]|nr:sulfate permease [Chitinophagaceae bacterium]